MDKHFYRTNVEFLNWKLRTPGWRARQVFRKATKLVEYYTTRKTYIADSELTSAKSF